MHGQQNIKNKKYVLLINYILCSKFVLDYKSIYFIS